MRKPLNGKTAVITGASRGIGRATAIALAGSGANVAFSYLSHPEEAEETLRAIHDLDGRAISFQGDVADLTSVEALVEAAVNEFGSLDIAVSNAAYSDRQPFYKADMDGFRRTVDVTMWGAFHLLLAASQQMIRQASGGVVVMVSSPRGFIPIAGSMAYNMSKAAVDHMAKTAALELAEHRVRVNVIHPGWIDTPGERKFASNETLAKGGARIPLGRLGTAEEIAAGIVFLCDPRNNYMTGSSLLIDGGISLPWYWSQD